MRNTFRNIVLGFGVLALSAGAGAVANKEYVCHKDKTIHVAARSVQAHLNHGDILARCEDIRKYNAVAMFRCGAAEGDLLVTAVSLSEEVPDDVGFPELGDHCADANANLSNGGFELNSQTPGAVGEDFEIEYFYSGEFIAIDVVNPPE